MYALVLLAGTVCAFRAPGARAIRKKVKDVTEMVFVLILIFSVVFVIMNQTDNVLSTEAFLGAQGLLAVIAVPFSWRARL